MRAMVLALGLMATPAVAADQFDLICTGGASPVRYRVDLAKGEACSHDCDRIWKMGPSTAGQLLLMDRRAAFRGDLEERLVVDRQTGRSAYSLAGSGRPVNREGQCEVATFSGFPAAKF